MQEIRLGEIGRGRVVVFPRCLLTGSSGSWRLDMSNSALTALLLLFAASTIPPSTAPRFPFQHTGEISSALWSFRTVLVLEFSTFEDVACGMEAMWTTW